jgi:PAS domain S-box-containing protein
MRKTSSALVETVSKSHNRLSLFSKSYDENISEQNLVLTILNSSKKEKDQDLQNIYSKIKHDGSILTAGDTVLNTVVEKQLFQKLKFLFFEKNQSLDSLFQQINKNNYDPALAIYNASLSTLYDRFQLLNNDLIKTIDNNDRKLISQIEEKIFTMSQVNLWISAILVLVMISLGVNLIKIGKINRKTNFELKESERKYRALTEQTNEIIVKCDVNGNFVFANDLFKKTFEYDDNELTSLSFSSITPDPDLKLIRFPAHGEEVISHVQKLFKTKSGKTVSLEGNIVAEYKNGIFTGTMGFFNDVTEKKQLEESLISSELKFRTFFNVAPIPMWVIDPVSYKFVLVNKAALAHYGFSEEDFLKKTVMDLRKDDDHREIEEDILKVRKDQPSGNFNKIYRYNVNHFKNSGEKIEVELYTSPIVLEGRNCILTIAIDVTERNQYENKITKAIIKTQEDERFEIGSELHDNVCQILAAAGINLSRLKPSLKNSELDLYFQSSEGIRLATEEIRNLSHRLAPAFFDNTTLEEAFEGLVKSFNINDSYNVSMCFDNCVKNHLLSQELQLNLYRILQEQLRNIIKYAKCTKIEIGVCMKKNKLKMRIADNGTGFDLNEVKSGIGLTNMKRRAELFGGEMQINASPGNGSELIITIPV